MNVFQIKELLPSLRGVVAGVIVDARVTAHASAPIMGANATATGGTVMVPATRTSRNRPTGSTTAAQSTTAPFVDATIKNTRSSAAPRSTDGATSMSQR